MNNTDQDDTEYICEVVTLAKKSNTEAFSTLYTTYFSPIYKYIYFRIGNKAEVDDLVQDVFLKAFSSFSNYSNEGEYAEKPFLAYLYTIARNSTIDHYRKKKPVEIDEEEYLNIADTQDTPEEFASKKHTSEILLREISNLPTDQEEVVTLRCINGFSTKEISSMLDKTEDAIRQLQSRAIKHLRKKLKDLFI